MWSKIVAGTVLNSMDPTTNFKWFESTLIYK